MSGVESVRDDPDDIQEFWEALAIEDDSTAMAAIDSLLARGRTFCGDESRPLYSATFDRRRAVVEHLVKRGARLEYEWPGDWGDMALHVAAEAGDVEIARMLLSADGRGFLNVFDAIDRTPLIIAAERGDLAMVRFLIWAGCDVDANNEPQIGDTAIKRAVEANHPEVVRALLASGADPTIEGWMRLTAIHQAQRGGEKTRPILEMIRSHLNLPERRWRELLLRG